MYRFIKTQNTIYQGVISELKSGEKKSHWMWYIFPQITGLASSSTARHFSIKSKAEAFYYLNSTMTLFSYFSNSNSIYHQIIEQYFNGQCDHKTILLLERKTDVTY